MAIGTAHANRSETEPDVHAEVVRGAGTLGEVPYATEGYGFAEPALSVLTEQVRSVPHTSGVPKHLVGQPVAVDIGEGHFPIALVLAQFVRCSDGHGADGDTESSASTSAR